MEYILKRDINKMIQKFSGGSYVSQVNVISKYLVASELQNM